jgi:hypothetical protein
MRKGIWLGQVLGLMLLLIGAGSAVWAEDTAATVTPEVATMQQQINELKDRLAKLEEQLTKTQTAQKKTEDARAKEVREHKITGYIQNRYRSDSAPDGKKEFLVRRVRTNVQGDISPRTFYRIELQADAKEKGYGTGSKVQLRTAYIEQKLNPVSRVRFGQTVIPFGYELEESVPNLWTGERSLWMDRLFPDQRDIGVHYQWAKDKQSPSVDLGLFNGTIINASENNARKDPMVRVKVPFTIGNYDNGSVAVSYYDGRNGVGPKAYNRKRLGAGSQGTYGPWAYLAEYVTGEDANADVIGWYAQLGHQVGKSDLLFVKYDMYDENTNKTHDEFKRWNAGYYHDIDPRNRLTLVYEWRNVGEKFSERSKWDGNAAYFQWQIKY